MGLGYDEPTTSQRTLPLAEYWIEVVARYWGTGVVEFRNDIGVVPGETGTLDHLKTGRGIASGDVASTSRT